MVIMMITMVEEDGDGDDGDDVHCWRVFQV